MGVGDGFGADVINITGNGACSGAFAFAPHADNKMAEINRSE